MDSWAAETLLPPVGWNHVSMCVIDSHTYVGNTRVACILLEYLQVSTTTFVYIATLVSLPLSLILLHGVCMILPHTPHQE